MADYTGMTDEQRARDILWAGRARRFTEHALYHMASSDPTADLEVAIECIRIADGDDDAAELAEIDIPGDEKYPCPWVYGRDCGYRAREP